MKRAIVWIILLMFCAAALACAANGPDPAEPVAVRAPAERDVSLWLPLGGRGDVTKLLKQYAGGFVSGNGKLLTFSADSADPAVALASLFEDGTLCILAVREGKTTVTVTAVSETGESAAGRINVTVHDARRVAVLILVGVLAVVLLILFGKPAKNMQKPEEQPADAAPQTDAPEGPEGSEQQTEGSCEQ